MRERITSSDVDIEVEVSQSAVRRAERQLASSPALKGEGSLRAVHRFTAYRSHLHHLTASGFLQLKALPFRAG